MSCGFFQPGSGSRPPRSPHCETLYEVQAPLGSPTRAAHKREEKRTLTLSLSLLCLAFSLKTDNKKHVIKLERREAVGARGELREGVSGVLPRHDSERGARLPTPPPPRALRSPKPPALWILFLSFFLSPKIQKAVFLLLSKDISRFFSSSFKKKKCGRETHRPRGVVERVFAARGHLLQGGGRAHSRRARDRAGRDVTGRRSFRIYISHRAFGKKGEISLYTFLSRETPL